ncbi:hypothetical protein M0R72_10835 [Candidatus Pacearchaeota archaeon]|jgi:hypothetical protein|nr:hypothetical protein [Candidatus Pacearchaeota archaeon]
MKTALLHILTAALLAVILFGVASADPINKWRQPYVDINGTTYYVVRDGRAMVVDTCFGLGLDTVTVHRARGCEGISIGFVCDSLGGATDSIAVFYRPIFLDSWSAVAVGSSWIALPIRSAADTTAYLLDWTPGAEYWIEPFSPVYAPLLQFAFQGGLTDTFQVTGVIEQIKIERLP